MPSTTAFPPRALNETIHPEKSQKKDHHLKNFLKFDNPQSEDKLSVILKKTEEEVLVLIGPSRSEESGGNTMKWLHPGRQIRPKSSVVGLVAPALCIALAVSGCSSPAEAMTLTDNYTYQKQEPEMDDLTRTAIQEYSWKLFLTLDQDTEQNENVMLSPYANCVSLDLIAKAAGGQSLTEIEEVLGLPESSLCSAAQTLMSTQGRDEDKNGLTLCSSIWLDQKYLGDVNEDYLRSAKEDLNSEVWKLDLKKDGLREINDWASKGTDGRIKEVLKEVPDDPAAFLCSLMDFQGKWENPYHAEDVNNGIFQNADGTQSNIPFMESYEWQIIHSEDFVGFLKPFEDERYVMMALLPADEERSIDEVLSDLSYEQLMEKTRPEQDLEALVYLPKFSIETKANLIPVLKDLGITSVFDPRLADLSGLSKSTNLVIDQINHNCALIVEEEGAKASAVESVGIVAESAWINESMEIRFDRPFFAAILDMQQNVPIIMGIVRTLEQE